MKYLSVCSGIEAATAAWHPFGWLPVAFSEIEKFPSAVLAYHYPHVPNLGDMTKFKDWPDVRPDVLVGGTPCQSFSVAGLRKGMADPRGNLALTYLAIADRYRPKWLLWENVPGVLSSNGGRDFGAFLGGLAELGYGFAYRVLDAQYVRVDGFGRAVPQRRRRVFVVGYLGDWRRAAAVLFERESLHWNSAPRRETGEAVAPTISARPSGGGGLGTDFDCGGGLLAFGGNNTSGPIEVSAGLNAKSTQRQDFESETFVTVAPCLDASYARLYGHDDQHIDSGAGLFVKGPIAFDTTQITSKVNRSNPQSGDACHPLASGAHPPAIAFDSKASGRNGFAIGEISPTLRAMGHKNSHTSAGGQVAVAFDMRGREGGAQFEGPHETANIRAASGGSSRSYVAQTWAVRRLTPTECERLQGFPDGYTNVPWRGNISAPDGPRYKALGNSMACNVMRWIGHRIQMVSEISTQESKGKAA